MRDTCMVISWEDAPPINTMENNWKNVQRQIYALCVPKYFPVIFNISCMKSANCLLVGLWSCVKWAVLTHWHSEGPAAGNHHTASNSCTKTTAASSGELGLTSMTPVTPHGRWGNTERNGNAKFMDFNSTMLKQKKYKTLHSTETKFDLMNWFY